MTVQFVKEEEGSEKLTDLSKFTCWVDWRAGLLYKTDSGPYLLSPISEGSRPLNNSVSFVATSVLDRIIGKVKHWVITWVLIRTHKSSQIWNNMEITNTEVKEITLDKLCIVSMCMFEMKKLILDDVTNFPQWNSAIFFSQSLQHRHFLQLQNEYIF